MTSPDLKLIEMRELSRVCRGDHDNPHAILGPHVHGGQVSLRVLDGHATGVVARGPWGEARLEREYLDVWSGILPGPTVPQYHLVIESWDEAVVQQDPYRFEPTLGDVAVLAQHTSTTSVPATVPSSPRHETIRRPVPLTLP